MIRSLNEKKMKEPGLLGTRKKKIAGKHRSDLLFVKGTWFKKKSKIK